MHRECKIFYDGNGRVSKKRKGEKGAKPLIRGGHLQIN